MSGTATASGHVEDSLIRPITPRNEPNRRIGELIAATIGPLSTVAPL
jgi:hypothetical protein